MSSIEVRQYQTSNGRRPLSEWLGQLRDAVARARIIARLDRLPLWWRQAHASERHRASTCLLERLQSAQPHLVCVSAPLITFAATWRLQRISNPCSLTAMRALFR